MVSGTRDPDPPVFRGDSATICGLENKRSRSTGFRAVPLTFVVSRTRDPDPPVFRAVPLALHLISHSLGNERS